MKSPFHHIKHAHTTFEHFHKNLHHAFVLILGAIIGMLRGASHILTPTTATWQRGGFITSDFWEQNPSNGNIQYALFGDGTPGSTAYTRTWSQGCSSSMNILSLQPGSFNGGTITNNTIYLLSSGTYTLSTPLVITNNSCVALVGIGQVRIQLSSPIHITTTNNLILDNLLFDGQTSTMTGIEITNSQNITLHNIDVYRTNNIGMYANNSSLLIDTSRIYNNVYGFTTINTNAIINNTQFFNNHLGLYSLPTFPYQPYFITINNSQFYNNSGINWPNVAGAVILLASGVIINNTQFYNNQHIGLALSNINNFLIHKSLFYNNTTGLSIRDSTGKYYNNLQFFTNNSDIYLSNSSFTPGSWSPFGWTNGNIMSGGNMMGYNWVTNPQNANNQFLLNGNNRNTLRGSQPFTPLHPIRYIFGANILKQQQPIWYNGIAYLPYGINQQDYDTNKYITEPPSTLPLLQQQLVTSYFGSGSWYTQNRITNNCSLSAFNVVSLPPQTFSSPYYFQDHTIYMLTGGEYRSTTNAPYGFIFSGNCIALIGQPTTIFTKSSMNMQSLFYAKDAYNLILDTLKIEGTYFGMGNTSPATNIGLHVDGNTNNSTLHNIQIANNSQYGILLGLGSQYITINNSQFLNNSIAGIYLSYASNYNIINNVQTYNNGNYGIWFANGSSRNTINNTQSYNNNIGIYGDLTTTENVIHRSAIYNNSNAGIYFKNSSNNSFNDVRIFNNPVGIRTLYASSQNKFYGELVFSHNGSIFDGTNGNDISLSPGNVGLFPYQGTIVTGVSLAGCTYATNPLLSGTSINLLNANCNNTGYSTTFISPYTMYINYMFGLNVYKQKPPVKYSSGSNLLTQLPSQHDPNKYIAEIAPIRDDKPENVIFTVSGIIHPNTRYTTNIYTAGVLNVSVPVNIFFSPITTSGHLIINGNSTGLTGIVNNGDTIQIRVLSASGFSQTITGIITIGSVITTFTITTRDINQTPTTGSFAFASFSSMPINTFTGSTVTVSGIETGVYASIVFQPTTTSGRLEIYSGNAMIASGTTGLLVYHGNQVKAIGQSASGYGQTITGIVTIGFGSGIFTITTKGSDTTPPTPPLLTYPISGESLFFVIWEWIASVDTGSGIEGYLYQIAEDPNFIHIVTTGFIGTITGTLGWPHTGFTATNDTFYRRLQAKDRDGNLSLRSNTGRFKAISFPQRKFYHKNNANLRTYYDSNEITIQGIKTGISLRASVNTNGILYKNATEVGTGTYVQNGDKLYITVRSSNRYGKSVTAFLTIANRTLPFTVTTKEEQNTCIVSEEDQEVIHNIFDLLIQNYSGDQNKYEEFLITMQSMLEDEIDLTNDCNLQYLKYLIADALGIGTGSIQTGTHIAPNCKEYLITYNPSTASYTSPTLLRPIHFINRDTLTRYIDSKNPGDCRINTYGISSRIFTNTDPNKHIASNGKIYFIIFENGKYTSNDFIYKKYFTTITELRAYIDKNNPLPEVRNHEVDPSFSPQIFIAPNGKEYKIYKTNRGYMSYKLLKVQYFSTLGALQAYIIKNNPK